VAVFSASCRGFVRVARKGLREGISCRLESSNICEEAGEDKRRERKADPSLRSGCQPGGKEPNAETVSANWEEKPDEGRGDWVDCGENMGHGSAEIDYCQDIVL